VVNQPISMKKQNGFILQMNLLRLKQIIMVMIHKDVFRLEIVVAKNYAFELLKNERNWLREVLRDKENDSNFSASDIKELEDKLGSLSVAMNKIA